MCVVGITIYGKRLARISIGHNVAATPLRIQVRTSLPCARAHGYKGFSAMRLLHSAASNSTKTIHEYLN
jgi:hypothetical protein